MVATNFKLQLTDAHTQITMWSPKQSSLLIINTLSSGNQFYNTVFSPT